MQKNKTSKGKSFPSQESREGTSDRHNEHTVHYEIINTSKAKVASTRPDSDETFGDAFDDENSENMTKGRGSVNTLWGEAKRDSTRQNETALGRLKRKFKRKSSKSVKVDENLKEQPVDSMAEQATSESSGSFGNIPNTRTEHVYDVPSIKSAVDENKDKGVEPLYENGHIWAENNQVTGNISVSRIDDDSSFAAEEKISSNSAVGGHDLCAGSASPQTESESKTKRWQQAKSRSLPVPRSRVSAQPPMKSPSQGPPVAVGYYHSISHDQETSSSDDSGNESSVDDFVEPLPSTQSPRDISYNRIMRTRSLPVPPKLDYNRQFLDGLNDLCKCGWYWGPLTSKEAEVMLRGTPNGTFLVRDSNDNRYLLSLTFRSERRTLHTRIEFCKGKFSFYAAPFISSACHESIVELIDDCVKQSKEKVFCYSKGHGNNGAAFPVRLVKAVSRFEQVCSLQHLCRFVIRQQYSLENISSMPLPVMMKRYLNKNHFDATKQG